MDAFIDSEAARKQEKQYFKAEVILVHGRTKLIRVLPKSVT
jgi:hypothetical protein